MIYCTDCGMQLIGKTKFCQNCASIQDKLAGKAIVPPSTQIETATDDYDLSNKVREEIEVDSSLKAGRLSWKSWYKKGWFWLIILLFMGYKTDGREFRAMLIFPIGGILFYNIFWKENGWFGFKEFLRRILTSKIGKIILIVLGILLVLMRVLIMAL